MKEKEEQRLIKLKQADKEFFDMGMKYVCGIDEAGRGPLAGPVVVASVIMPKDSMIEGINDSKKVLQSEKEQALTAAKELAEEKAKSIKDAAIAEAGRITEELSQNKLSAKDAVLKEIIS